MWYLPIALQLQYPQLPGALVPGPNVTIAEFLQYLYQALLVVGVGLAVIRLVSAGLLYLTASDNPQRLSLAREGATNALLGLLILFGSVVIVSTIDPNLTSSQIGSLPAGPLPTVAQAPALPAQPDLVKTVTTLEQDTRQAIAFLKNQILTVNNVIFAINAALLFNDLDNARQVDCSTTQALCVPVGLTPEPVLCLWPDFRTAIMGAVNARASDLAIIHNAILQLLASEKIKKLAGATRAINTCMSDKLHYLAINRQAEISGALDYLNITQRCSQNSNNCLLFYCLK